jgi:hypothetical protein
VLLVCELTEEVLNQIVVFVAGGIKAVPSGGCGSERGDRFCAYGCDGNHSPLLNMALVDQNMSGLSSVKQRLNLPDVVAFASSEDEADRMAECIGGGMNLGAQATF